MITKYLIGLLLVQLASTRRETPLSSNERCPTPKAITYTTVGYGGRLSSSASTREGICLHMIGNTQISFEFDACTMFSCTWAPKYNYYLSSVKWSYYSTVAYTGQDWRISCSAHPFPSECGRLADSMTMVRVGALGTDNARLALTVDWREINITKLQTYTQSFSGSDVMYIYRNCLNLLLTPYADSVTWYPIRICQTFSKTAPKHRPGMVLTDQKPNVRAQYTADFTLEDTFSIATGVIDLNSNSWMERAVAAREAYNDTDCLVCMVSRPMMYLVTPPIDDDLGASCILPVMSQDVPPQSCQKWDAIHPLSPASAHAPTFNARHIQLNSTCFQKDSSTMARHKDVGQIPLSMCRSVVTTSDSDGSNQLTKGRADVWWYCGNARLFNVLPVAWTGRCALVSTIYPILVVPLTSHKDIFVPQPSILKRVRRELNTPHPFSNSPIYIDAIGIPRGVPDEYKLADQVAAGFENIPIIAAIFPITPNKNVDRINYLHYNQQRLANFTRDGFEAVHAQLAATSLMTMQTHIAVDMLLTKEGGLCAMFGEQCCTVIPNNTAPDGSLTRTLQNLRALSIEMKSHSGVDTSFWDDWMAVFGKYKSLVTSVLISIAVFASLLTLCGCCCIPCLRGLCQRLITTAIEKRDLTSPPPYAAMFVEEVRAVDEDPAGTFV